MPKRRSARDARILADRLRAEAARSRPVFSEALHARICRAVRRLNETGTGSEQGQLYRRDSAYCEVLVPVSFEPLRQRRPEGSGADRVAASRRRGPRWALAAVAAALLGTAILAWQAAPRGGSPGTAPSGRSADQTTLGTSPFADSLDFQVDAYTVTGLAASVPNQIDALVDSVITAQQWAYLDHDAQVTVKMLADRLPFDLASSLTMADPPASP